MTTLNAFTKEVSRFALMSKKECLEDLLTKADDNDAYKSLIQAKMDEINQELTKQTNSRSNPNKKPRTLNAYNHFVKAKLPEIGKEHPEMDNRARMKHVSELWKTMSPEEKKAFACE